MADFITYEPNPEENFLSLFIFNITNTKEVITTGYKPKIFQTGPYGYTKSTYRYDISFETDDSDHVTYKEYSMLNEIGNTFVNISYDSFIYFYKYIPL